MKRYVTETKNASVVSYALEGHLNVRPEKASWKAARNTGDLKRSIILTERRCNGGTEIEPLSKEIF